MSRAARKQLLGTMETLQKANRMVVKTIKGTQQDGVHELLVECQECAIAIGNQIEQLYGEGTQSVSGLEMYCEIVYQMTQYMGDSVACKELCESTKKLLEGISVDMEREIPDRTEAVFLPYKASMWDSMESVWKAADEDPDCDAYVIPIPYYDKNQDGSFREEYYEGDLYPKNVPIMRYDTYDFAMRKPDMIFIHNPYDGANFVTSVPPFFYAKNLKQFTDMLVYIPYFVLNEISPKNRIEVENMKHFCMTPGVIHADKVFVQSDDMRQIYIEVMTELVGENTRKYWEDKIFGVGSPKIDKVLGTPSNYLNIPKEWLELIDKPDGSRKKVVFYNIGISRLLQYNEKMFEKIRDVFRIFKEKREEVTLLWRPHPLIKSTLESMRPQLQKEYEIIVKKYIAEGWGIYDESPDMNRAIAISDAYYGDPSSITELFLELKKDVFIQNPYVTYNQQMQDFYWANDFWIEEDYIYFVPYMYNLLCCYNLKMKKMEHIADIPIKHYGYALYNSIVKDKDKIVLLPSTAKEICVYDIKTTKWEKIKVERSANETELFCGYAIWKDSLYIFPQMYSQIVKLNLVTNVIEYLDKWDNIDWQLQADSCTIMHKIYMLIRYTNQVLIYNMEDETFEIKEISGEDEYFTICNISKEEFYLTNKRGDIIVWNEYTGNVNKIINNVCNFEIDTDMKMCGAFSSSIVIQEYVYFFPGAANMVIKIRREAFKSEDIEVVEENVFEDRLWKTSWYSKIKTEKEWLYGFDSVRKEFFSLDSIKSKKKTYQMAVEEFDNTKMDKWYEEYSSYIVPAEYNQIRISSFLKKIEVKETRGNQRKKQIGRAIYLECIGKCFDDI